MSYQRWGKPGRFYIWMGNDGLHVWPSQETKVLFEHGPEGRDNAKATIEGLADFLRSEGFRVDLKIKKPKDPTNDR